MGLCGIWTDHGCGPLKQVRTLQLEHLRRALDTETEDQGQVCPNRRLRHIRRGSSDQLHASLAAEDDGGGVVL